MNDRYEAYVAAKRCRSDFTPVELEWARPVSVHVIRAETESAISRNYKRKEREASEMAAALVAQVQAHTIGHKAALYQPGMPMIIPEWVGE